MHNAVHVHTAEDVVEEEEGTDSKRQEEEGKGEEGEREEELSAEQQRLRHVITATLTSHLKQLKVCDITAPLYHDDIIVCMHRCQ